MGILIVDNDESLFKEWKIELDFTNQYNDYLKTKDFRKLNQDLKAVISNPSMFVPENATEINNIFTELDAKNSYDECLDLYERIYDILDTNQILLNVKIIN